MRDGWTETTLGEVVVINPEAARGMAEDDEIVYVDLSSVSAEFGISSDLYRGSFGEAPGRARRVIRTQDVLVSTVRPYLRGFALVPNFLDGEIASTGFAVLRAKPNTILSGLVWAIVGMNNFVDYLMDRATGSSYPAVRPEDVASFNFCLPPLAEQKRIVDVVSSVDAYIDALQQQADFARIARNAVLNELLSTGGDDWTETTLGDISTFVSGRELPEDLAPDTPYVGLEHVEPKTTSISTWGNIECLSSSVTPFEPEDTLFGRLRPYLHKVAFADFPGVCSPEILVLRSNTRCEPKFLYLLCSRESTVKKCVDMSAGTRMPRTSTSDLASIEIQLPPFSEQKRIVAIILSMDEVIQSTEQAVADAKNLRSGLLSDLLSGEHEIPASYDVFVGAA
jgi:restriction endonuclease S subunit